LSDGAGCIPRKKKKKVQTREGSRIKTEIFTIRLQELEEVNGEGGRRSGESEKTGKQRGKSVLGYDQKGKSGYQEGRRKTGLISGSSCESGGRAP